MTITREIVFSVDFEQVQQNFTTGEGIRKASAYYDVRSSNHSIVTIISYTMCTTFRLYIQYMY